MRVWAGWRVPERGVRRASRLHAPEATLCTRNRSNLTQGREQKQSGVKLGREERLVKAGQAFATYLLIAGTASMPVANASNGASPQKLTRAQITKRLDALPDEKTKQAFLDGKGPK